MGCDYFYSGKLEDVVLQEKIINFYLSHEKNADLLITPRLDMKFKTRIRGDEDTHYGEGRPDRIQSAGRAFFPVADLMEKICNRKSRDDIFDRYPFNFYGVVPNCKHRLLPHFQFVFNRNEGGTLGYFDLLPESYGYPIEEARAMEIAIERGLYDPDGLKVHFNNGGYTRIGYSFSFALFLYIIKLRWWPDFKLLDDGDLCAKAEELVNRYGLAEKLRNEDLDFSACESIFNKEHGRRHPSGK